MTNQFGVTSQSIRDMVQKSISLVPILLRNQQTCNCIQQGDEHELGIGTFLFTFISYCLGNSIPKSVKWKSALLPVVSVRGPIPFVKSCGYVPQAHYVWLISGKISEAAAFPFETSHSRFFVPLGVSDASQKMWRAFETLLNWRSKKTHHSHCEMTQNGVSMAKLLSVRDFQQQLTETLLKTWSFSARFLRYDRPARTLVNFLPLE